MNSSLDLLSLATSLFGIIIFCCHNSIPVSVQVNAMMVVETIKRNGDKAKRLLLKLVPMIADQDWTSTLQKNKELVQTSVMLP